MRFSKFLLIVLISTFSLGAEEFSKVGNAGAKFLNIGVSAHAMGMGEAYVAIANDPSTIFWNPAGIANVKGDAAYIGYTNWIGDIAVPSFSYVKDMGLYGKLAVMVSGISVGGMQEAVVLTDTTLGQSELTGKEFSYFATQIGFGFSRYFTDKFAAGAVVKGIYEGYGSYSHCASFAIDAGTYFWTGFRTLRIAMALQHLGADMKPVGTYILESMQGSQMQKEEREFESYPLPMVFKVGAAMEVVERPDAKLTVAIEAAHPTDNTETIALGGELNLKDMIFVRLGYKLADKDTYVCGFGAGVGIKFRGFQLDYSFSDMTYLPDVHRVGIIYSF
ncbi:MAG: hypothetical protein DRQ10_01875 [Candidatus Hydrothermota bacterium]|nr:MAG: hypothetical protein DRQ10_01875 [Candidatus Hydrothermae bacterium]